jgi:acetyl-CoA carboxylase carboxyltransferase component
MTQQLERLEPTPGPVSHRDALHQRRDREIPAPRGLRVYTAGERARALCDPGTFVELTPMRAGGTSGIVSGWGTVQGRPVVVVAHDAAVAAGAISAVFAEGVQKAQRLAIDRGFPIVYLNDSSGARIHDGIHALHGCGGIFKLNVEASTKIPQISVILGPCAGAAAYSPALTDWIIMVKASAQMFLTGPDVVRSATGEDATADEIGGSGLHTRTSGVAHLEVESEDAAMQATRDLLSYLPSMVGGELPLRTPQQPDPAAAAALPYVVPDKSSVVFDMNDVLDGVLDEGERFELMPDYAPSILTVFGRLAGRPVGVLANQPAARGGILDAKSSVKASRFVEFCTRFGVPVLTFVDVPGFLPGTVEESRGVITHGATLLRAYAAATSPLLTVVVRKAYGGAYIAMGSKSLGADFSWAWSNSEVAVMGPGGAVNLLHRRALAGSDDPDALRDELASDYRENVARPWLATEAGIVDDVILPEETRARMVAALAMLCTPGGAR